MKKPTLVKYILTVAYGGCMGGVCLFILPLIFPWDPLVLAIVGVYLIAACALLGWVFACVPSLSTKDLVLLIPFAPLLVLWLVIAMGGVALVMIVGLACSPIFIVFGTREERRFVAQMKSQGRFRTRQELVPALDAGRGTLICKFGPKGYESVWWTDENLEEQGFHCLPLGILIDDSLDDLWDDALNADESAFRCEREYLDHDSGKAAYLPWAGRQWEHLARDYPDCRLVTVPWGHRLGPMDDELEDDEEVVPPAIGE